MLLAAGDIASCASSGDEATAALLDGLTGTIAALGDLVYDAGTPAEFATCYEPSWGRHKSRTRPAPGNHDYETPGAAGYFGYFGATAGDPTHGYYSYDLGDWHVVVLNSNCDQVGGCGAGSSQEQWLRADLDAHPATCTLAYWHHPRFSSGSVHGNTPEVAALWQALYEHGADVVLAGTSITTSGSRRKMATASSLRHLASANSWWVPGGGVTTGSARRSRTVKSGMATPSVCWN